ncbi:MAG: iron-sulfur cluster repair di-iron protein [Actinomycetales bacterium]|nr:iron-sulfur cluster repair di-iron protein [Actinomycetales bacterium]
MTIDVNISLGDLVAQDPNRARIFEELEIDYCCNGHRSLSEAVTTAGGDLDSVIASLEALAAVPTPAANPTPTENAALAHDIVDTHHAYMWEEMPRLQALVDKVHGVHLDRHPELAEVKAAFDTALAELEPHMTKEERIVFPAISRMEKGGAAGVPSFAEPIAQLRDEHDEVGRLFKELRELTNGYAPPEDACGSYRMMLQGLETMERDLHEHIHKENNILFPRVLELESHVRQG